VISLCDTNNTANDIDLVIPCNNKGKKSLGIIFYILAKEYMTHKRIDTKELNMDNFMDESS